MGGKGIFCEGGYILAGRAVFGQGMYGDEFADAVGGRVDGRIAPRSGLAVKSFIDTGAGVVDADYRGQVRVLLFNHSEVDFEGTSFRMEMWRRMEFVWQAGREGDMGYGKLADWSA